MFHDILLPDLTGGESAGEAREFDLRRIKQFKIPFEYNLLEGEIVVFDFETTGLDPREDDIIEVGAIRLKGFKEIGQFSTLIHTSKIIDDHITRITGLTAADLVGQPSIENALDGFLQFIGNGVLVAHNAEFDWAFLKAKCDALSIDLDWPCFCTLKLARKFLPDLDGRGLDNLAKHYDLTFESRHRSIGDVKVTCDVLEKLLTDDCDVNPTWGDISAIAAVSDMNAKIK